MNVPPLSVKAVVLHQGRVLLLVNERDEWDLPGGRPEAGEDHRTALAREVREETGLSVEIGAFLDEHLFEVLPQRFVRIVAFGCTLAGTADVTLSDEHSDAHWLPLDQLGPSVAGRRLPAGYLGAIRQLISQPRSPSAREV
ncbi:MAG: NUDIX hydrolase [Reyranella sp.]|uniref:NUDIX hydrolase n=1 Tax=Reyranella sp. TaxID=1929291 RepID=UPI00122BCF28|nr:NUDIX hydrolase [Reyranella sp.]TAJ42964.1 MAG: NUDIX hydrolase [Reyranella sp.]